MFKTITLLKAIQLARAVYAPVSIEREAWSDHVKITKKEARRVLSKFLQDKAPEYLLMWENDSGSTIATFSLENGIMYIGR